jgi:phenylpropionate dioxygenase-like ring-hydroxylating dioxygenase large terminal subunit
MSAEHLQPMDTPPPDFLHARNRRQKVRAAGMNPDYWYPVEYDRNIKAGQTVGVTFWKRPIAVYRGMDGVLRAMEDRCAHRQLKLSGGSVDGCKLVCPYHGWSYDCDGRLANVPHDLFGRSLPSLKIATCPVRVRYGLVWIFPGDPELANQRAIPEIPEIEGPVGQRWGCVPVDFLVQGHHSMIIDNVSDFTHAYLHRKYRPFTDAKLTKCEAVGDKVFVSYDTQVGTGRISSLFIDRQHVNMNQMDLCYDYPYQRSNTDGKIKHWCFVLPIDERTTRAFFLFYFDSFKVPFLPLRFPRRVMNLILHAANRLHIRPLLVEDKVAVEAEQAGYERYYEAPIAELNPAVPLFQALTVRKWEEHLAKSGQLRAGATTAEARTEA